MKCVFSIDKTHWVIGVVFAFLLPMCASQDDVGNCGGCGEGEVCYVEQTCRYGMYCDKNECGYGKICTEETTTYGCTKECETRVDCPSGQDCVPYQGSRVCEPICNLNLCDAGQGCLDAKCTPMDCSYLSECPDEDLYCVAVMGECKPEDGACLTDGDCYPVPEFHLWVSEAACWGSYCRTSSKKRYALPEEQMEGQHIYYDEALITAPEIHQRFESQEEIRFRWAKAGYTTILLVLEDKPRTLGEMMGTAIWGKMMASDSSPVASWKDGYHIENGVWSDSPAKDAPRDKVLYFVVQMVKEGSLHKVSTLIPFQVADRYQTIGDECSEDKLLNATCYSPEEPLVCYDGQCRKVCLSEGDCSSYGLSCSPPKHGLVRICE